MGNQAEAYNHVISLGGSNVQGLLPIPGYDAVNPRPRCGFPRVARGRQEARDGGA